MSLRCPFGDDRFQNVSLRRVECVPSAGRCVPSAVPSAVHSAADVAATVATTTVGAAAAATTVAAIAAIAAAAAFGAAQTPPPPSPSLLSSDVTAATTAIYSMLLPPLLEVRACIRSSVRILPMRHLPVERTACCLPPIRVCVSCAHGASERPPCAFGLADRSAPPHCCVQGCGKRGGNARREGRVAPRTLPRSKDCTAQRQSYAMPRLRRAKRLHRADRAAPRGPCRAAPSVPLFADLVGLLFAAAPRAVPRRRPHCTERPASATPGQACGVTSSTAPAPRRASRPSHRGLCRTKRHAGHRAALSAVPRRARHHCSAPRAAAPAAASKQRATTVVLVGRAAVRYSAVRYTAVRETLATVCVGRRTGCVGPAMPMAVCVAGREARLMYTCLMQA